MKKKTELTPKRLKFIDAYMVSFNGTQAAIEAGYAPSAATVQASRLLTFDNVKEEIARRLEEITAKSTEKKAYLLSFWQSVIDDPNSTMTARLRASDMMAKYLAMYGNVLEIAGNVDSPIKVVWGE